MARPIISGPHWWTLEDANEASQLWTKIHKEYCTCLKGEPYDPEMPEECWAVTNAFDPGVRRDNAGL